MRYLDSGRRWVALALGCCAALACPAVAFQPTQPATAPADAGDVVERAAEEMTETATDAVDAAAQTARELADQTRAVATRVAAPEALPVAVPAPPADFWPQFDSTTVTWFAIVVILVLTLRFRPIFSERNLDGLVLAATCLLLVLRDDLSPLPGWAAGQTAQWWAYLLLTIAGIYWLLRGLLSLGAEPPRRQMLNVAPGALLVLVVAGLAVSIRHVATAPLSSASRDGIIGGEYLAETGALPYGETTPADRRSPLLYVLHAGAVQIAPPADDVKWDDPTTWQDPQRGAEAMLPTARLVNFALLFALLIGLLAIGVQVHSGGMGWAMVALFCVFPGTLECLSRPDVMLPATLLTWTLALGLLPAAGGLLATIMVVLAGMAWPWAWLGLPVLLGCFFRSGWHALGSLVGLAVGVAGSLALITWLTPPDVPRADGALAQAGQPPEYVVTTGADGYLEVTPRTEDGPDHPSLFRWFWRYLVESENLRVDTVGPNRGQLRFADNVRADNLLYRNLAPEPEARAELNARYAELFSRELVVTRVQASVRTVLEQTWLAPERAPSHTLPAWSLWGRDVSSWWRNFHLAAKVAAGLLALLAGLLLLRRPLLRPVHLCGGLLTVAAAALLASYPGGVTNLAWLVPMALAVWAAGDALPEGGAAALPPPVTTLRGDMPADPLGPVPRITVEH